MDISYQMLDIFTFYVMVDIICDPFVLWCFKIILRIHVDVNLSDTK